MLLVIILKDSSLRRLHVSRTAASRIPCLEDSLPPDLLAWTLLALRTPVSRSPCLKVFLPRGFLASRTPCLKNSLFQCFLVRSPYFDNSLPQGLLPGGLIALRTPSCRTPCFEDSLPEGLLAKSPYLEDSLSQVLVIIVTGTDVLIFVLTVSSSH